MAVPLYSLAGHRACLCLRAREGGGGSRLAEGGGQSRGPPQAQSLQTVGESTAVNGPMGSTLPPRPTVLGAFRKLRSLIFLDLPGTKHQINKKPGNTSLFITEHS